MSTISITGIDALRAKLEANLPKARQAAIVELYKFGSEVMLASKHICPMDTGNLVNSGHVECPELGITSGGTPAFSFVPDVHVTEPQKASVVLGYGGAARKYALIVHENMVGTTQWTRPGSGPKFLETPLKAVQESLPARILKVYKDALKA